MAEHEDRTNVCKSAYFAESHWNCMHSSGTVNSSEVLALAPAPLLTMRDVSKEHRRLFDDGTRWNLGASQSVRTRIDVIEEKR